VGRGRGRRRRGGVVMTKWMFKLCMEERPPLPHPTIDQEVLSRGVSPSSSSSSSSVRARQR